MFLAQKHTKIQTQLLFLSQLLGDPHSFRLAWRRRKLSLAVQGLGTGDEVRPGVPRGFGEAEGENEPFPGDRAGVQAKDINKQT